MVSNLQLQIYIKKVGNATKINKAFKQLHRYFSIIFTIFESFTWPDKQIFTNDFNQKKTSFNGFFSNAMCQILFVLTAF